MMHLTPQIIGWFWGVSELFLNVRKRSKSDAIAKDRHSLGLIWVVKLVAILMGVFAAYHFHNCSLPYPRLAVEFGCCLFIIGIGFRWYSIIHLGRFFTTNVAIANDHQLVDTGPYRFLRHPSYTGSLLGVLGFALTFANWVTMLVIFIPSCAVILWRIHIEEQALADGLGEKYRGYMSRTKRLIPFVY